MTPHLLPSNALTPTFKFMAPPLHDVSNRSRSPPPTFNLKGGALENALESGGGAVQ